jgi:hypothetical protein
LLCRLHAHVCMFGNQYVQCSHGSDHQNSENQSARRSPSYAYDGHRISFLHAHARRVDVMMGSARITPARPWVGLGSFKASMPRCGMTYISAWFQTLIVRFGVTETILQSRHTESLIYLGNPHLLDLSYRYLQCYNGTPWQLS